MIHIKDIPKKELAPGILSKLVHGDKSSLSIVELSKGSVLPLHRHVHEQITYIVEGELEMMLGDEKHILKEGTVHVIPSNQPHSAVALTDCMVIDFFSPARDDYR
jgi:quercetin dioxygenase-like cupin family protein